MSDLLERTIRSARARLLPPPRLPLSRWIEQNIYLPSEVAARPGPVRLWPFQREIADAISDPTIERVTVRKAARVGYTTLLTGATASYIANEPAPILTLLPTDDSCRTYIVSDLEPIFDASPVVSGILSTAADETGRNTIRHRRFPGGSLKIVAARSPRNLRAHTVRILLIDEEDGMEVTSEGDPVDLAIKRTQSFPNRKIVRGSTPKDADTSSICRAYDASDRRIYEIRCFECGEFAEPQWAQIEWTKDKDAQGKVDRHHPETACWACPNCGVMIPERRKAEMVANGRWRATRPEVENHAGFALSALISPHVNASWAVLAAEYLELCHEPDRLKTFHNTLLGLPWSESVDATSADVLAGRVEAFGLNVQLADGEDLPLPATVLLLTAGVDVQPDRLEVVIYGWAKDGTAYALAHFVIWGNTLEGHVWRDLDELLLQKWKHPLGGGLGIEATCVDSGDGGTVEAVYAYCWPRMQRNVLAVKGVWGRRPVIEASKGRVSGGALGGQGRLWIVGVDEVKQILFTKFARYPEQVRFSASLPLSWFDQLTSERRVIRRVQGKPVRRFERVKNAAAEALDATVYAFAARYALPSVDFDNLADNQQVAYAAARAEGLSDIAARAWVANTSGESLRNPRDLHWDRSHTAEASVQWDPSRAAAIARQFGKRPRDMSVQEQVQASLWEMRTNPRFAPTWRALHPRRLRRVRPADTACARQAPRRSKLDRQSRRSWRVGLRLATSPRRREREPRRRADALMPDSLHRTLDCGIHLTLATWSVWAVMGGLTTKAMVQGY